MVVLYKKTKNGVEAKRFEPEHLESQLNAGWKLTKDDAKEVPTRAEADTNNTGKLSNKEVRAAAKKAGISDWKTGRIQSLKDRLWTN